MQRLFVTYRLKAGAVMQDFWNYSKEKDQPTVKAQEGVKSFEVYEIVGTDKGSKEFHIIEDVLVESYEKWVEITNRDQMKKNSAEWSRYGDEASVKVFIGKRII